MIELLVQIPGSVPQQTLNEALLLAIRSQQVKVMDILLRAGADPNTRDQRAKTALGLMTSLKTPSGIQLLLDFGADVLEDNLLHTAARVGNVDGLEMLLKAGAKVDNRDSSGATPLIVTAKYSNSMESITKLLIEHGASVNAKDRDGNTALHYAVTKLRGIATLVENGARSDLPNTDSNTPLMYAATEGLCSIIRVMMRAECDVNVANHAGKTPLHILAMKGHSCCLGEILKKGGDVSIRDNSGKRPLDDALEREQLMTCRQLIQFNCPLMNDVTILAELLLAGQYDLVKVLVLAGAPADELTSLLTSYNHNVEEAMVEWLRDVLGRPRTLLELSRFKIRRLIGAKNFVHKCDSLELPKYHKDLLKMIDLNHYE